MSDVTSASTALKLIDEGSSSMDKALLREQAEEAARRAAAKESQRKDRNRSYQNMQLLQEHGRGSETLKQALSESRASGAASRRAEQSAHSERQEQATHRQQAQDASAREAAQEARRRESNRIHSLLVDQGQGRGKAIDTTA